MAAGKDRHYGRASVVQAEESEVMNAAAGSTPASLTSRKAKKDRPGGAGRPIKKGVIQYMDNLTALTAVKSSILEGLAILPPIVESLEHSGVRVIDAKADIRKEHRILIGGNFDNFRQWADENELDVILTNDGREGKWLLWRLSAFVNGVEIKSFLSNKEKEEYDGAAV